MCNSIFHIARANCVASIPPEDYYYVRFLLEASLVTILTMLLSLGTSCFPTHALNLWLA